MAVLGHPGTVEVRGEERIERLLGAAIAAAMDAASAARAALIQAGVSDGRDRLWVAAAVDDLGAAIAARSSWRGAHLARHEAGAVAPARVAVERFAPLATVLEYEDAIALEQAVAALQCDPADHDEAAAVDRALQLACAATRVALDAIVATLIEATVAAGSPHVDTPALRATLAALAEAAGNDAVLAAVEGEGSTASHLARFALYRPWAELSRLLGVDDTVDAGRVDFVRACRLEGLLRELAASVNQTPAGELLAEVRRILAYDADEARYVLDMGVVDGATALVEAGRGSGSDHLWRDLELLVRERRVLRAALAESEAPVWPNGGAK